MISANGVFDRDAIKAAGRTVFFLNNGIHPGEPEGIDAAMMLVRDLCADPAKLDALGETALVFVPLYNVDGALNRSDTSRVNQDGPEQFGFRGNARHLDLNRDFIKCDSANARSFNRLFARWDPDVLVDTHTSNGADYQHTMTLIATQPDKLGGALGAFMRETMLPRLYAEMTERGWPMCPYINPRKEIPDDGIEDFLESPRFSTGYAALHHVIGFMPETHMLKPFAQRLESMRALIDTALAFTVKHGPQIQQLRAQTRAADRTRARWPLAWAIDESRLDDVPAQGLRRPPLAEPARELPAPELRPHRAVREGHPLVRPRRGGRRAVRSARVPRAAGVARGGRAAPLEPGRAAPLHPPRAAAGRGVPGHLVPDPRRAVRGAPPPRRAHGHHRAVRRRGRERETGSSPSISRAPAT